ncbi:hypothetical protein GGR54DRAFT_411808 [Hypoxylon sp. NC1633]|nr:hypothetical protein GGR54DRAFT_411808 [Hypoxylon sp. NC1633]
MALWQVRKMSSFRRQSAILLLACPTCLFLLLLLYNHHIPPNPRQATAPPLTPPISLLSSTQAPFPAILEPAHPNPDDKASQNANQAIPDPTPDLSSPRAPFIPWPLRRVCLETTHTPGLTFLCDNNSGGPGNIRNYVLTCVRYAVEAGATALVLPRIRTRSASNPSDLFHTYQPFSYMFDEPHFRAALAASCPRLAVYASVEDVPGARSKAQREGRRRVDDIVERVVPKHFGGSRAGCDARDPHRYTDAFGASFREWVRDSASERGWAAPNSVDNPRLIRFAWGVLWDWPVIHDGPEFAATFGGLLRIRADILDLADAVMASVRTVAASARSTEAAAGEAFLGIHLRTEADALSQWPSYENQTKNYLREAASKGYQGRVAYLASGNETETRKFGNEAFGSLQLIVKSKFDLLEGREAELEKLKALSWDQQALVDFVVLLSCDYFLGVSPSSFSINVALKRHLKEDGLYTRPWKVGGRGDGRSWLVGRYDRYWDDWLFMFDGMWP